MVGGYSGDSWRMVVVGNRRLVVFRELVSGWQLVVGGWYWKVGSYYLMVVCG